MTKPYTICALIAPLILSLSGCQVNPAGPAMTSPQISAREISVNGTYVHRATGIEFPELIIPFQRASVWEYDQTGNNIGVGYNLNSIREPAVLTLYLYPSSPTYFQDGKWKPVDTKAVFEDHYMDILVTILSSYKDPEIIDAAPFTLTQSGQTLRGKRAIVKLKEEFAGQEQECISCLYLFCCNSWFVQYRVTYPYAVYELAQESTEHFIRNFPVLPKMISQEF